MVHDIEEVLRYVGQGHHAFVGCDSEDRLRDFENLLRKSLGGLNIECLDARELVSGKSFAEALIASLSLLARQVRKRLPKRLVTLSAYLTETMGFYEARNKQGFLVINHIDDLIRSQRIFEVEGSLRGSMQLQDDIAVVLCGSNETINMMCRSDRPFYLSFRIFRL